MKSSWEISINEAGFGKVIVDGHDISNSVVAVTVGARVGHATRIRVTLIGEIEARVANPNVTVSELDPKGLAQ